MFKRILPTASAILSGLIVLGGLLFPDYAPLHAARLLVLQWAMIIVAFAFILGFLNLLRVHAYRVGRRHKGWFTSLLVIISAVGAAALVFVEGPTGPWSRRLLDALLIPGEGALLALTAVTLTLAAIRMLRVRRGVGGLLFAVVLLILLLGNFPYLPHLGTAAAWLREVPAMAGMRGLVLGVAIGIALTALRIILGLSQPHSD